MPKSKTHKATSKRVAVTKKKKFLSRQAGQDHFNAREASRVTMRKRRDKQSSPANNDALQKLLPYYKKRR